MNRLALALFLLPLVGGARVATACEPRTAGRFELDPTSDDLVPPAAPGALNSIFVTRGVGPECHDGGGTSSGLCDDLGTIYLSFHAAMDDRSPATDPETASVQQGVGYTLRLLEGTVPDGLPFDEDLPLAAFVSPDGGAGLDLWWTDGGSDKQEPFEFTLAVGAVDLADNRSTEVLFEISDPGRTDGFEGCPEPDAEAEAKRFVCATSSATGAWAVLLASAVVARRRR